MEYRVLARKYRPSSFADLIGQEVLVQTLTNAIAANRIHHAFVLTGIRGVGKTTTARIIARALNCEQGPTVTPCGTCAQCTMLAEDRHMDVIEMDAASRTGVNDVREIIETVQYAPVSARYKVYIIDEVHMLSTAAFNALLKTLEEPPPHTKFIFATTEARKIPVTILSRCQRFDLRRIPLEMLAGHLGNIATKENITVDAGALRLLAQAAEGSVRDGLSLLDQSIARHEGAAPIAEAEVRVMLGLADRAQNAELVKLLLEGKAAEALALFESLYTAGADPQLILQDMLELTHFITRIKLVPQAANDVSFAEAERNACAEIAKTASMPHLARLWQLLMKGFQEVKFAPSPASAAQMVLVRAAHMSDLPTPEQALKDMQGAAPAAFAPPIATPAAPPPPPAAPVFPMPTDFAGAVMILEQSREMLLASQLKQFASVVAFAPPQMTLHMTQPVPRDFVNRLAASLQKATGAVWQVALSDTPGAPTLQQQANAAVLEKKQAAADNPLVASVFEHFPGAEVVAVKSN